MAKATLKPYRLRPGKTHRVPNPNFIQDKDEPEESHKIAQPGDVVMLNDEQFKAFKDKFMPISTDSTDVRDADEAELDAAKKLAAETGENVDPNKPLDIQDQSQAGQPQARGGKDPFANARPTTTTL